MTENLKAKGENSLTIDIGPVIFANYFYNVMTSTCIYQILFHA